MVPSAPNDVALLNELAWRLAPDGRLVAKRQGGGRTGRARGATYRRAPTGGSLAPGGRYARPGRFPEAVNTARQALEMAVQQTSNTGGIHPRQTSALRSGNSLRETVAAVSPLCRGVRTAGAKQGRPVEIDQI